MNRRFSAILSLVPVFALLLCCGILLGEQVVNQLRLYSTPVWIMGTAEIPGLEGMVEETLVLPVNTSEDVLTTHQYAGTVTVTVRGEGQINEDIWHDALYQYIADKEKREFVEAFYGFLVDGDDLILRVFTQLPHYTSAHEYQFLYHVGDQLRPIAFRMVNGNSDDISEFVVEVSTVNKVSPRGR